MVLGDDSPDEVIQTADNVPAGNGVDDATSAYNMEMMESIVHVSYTHLTLPPSDLV